jgi:CrcB protein
VAGSALLAVLLVVLLERVPPSRYAAPFLGTGVLGGFTTFSTFAVDAVEISDAGRSWLAAVYVATSILAALAAAFIALVATRAGLRLPEHRRARRGEPDAAAEESLP